MGVIPTTAKASRSCVKNSMLKQTGATEDEKDLSSGQGTVTVSSADEFTPIGNTGFSSQGNVQTTTTTTPGTADQFIPGKDVEKIETDNQKYLDSFKAGFARDNEGFDNIEDYRKNKESKYKPKVVKGTDPEEKIEKEEDPNFETAKGLENFDARQDIRQSKYLNRMSRQAERREDRFERKFNADGTKKTKAEKREYRQKQRADRAASNIKRQQDIQKQVSQRQSLRDVQRSQGSFGGEKYQVGKVRENLAGIENRVKGPSSGGTVINDAIRNQSNNTTTFSSLLNDTGDFAKDLFGRKEGGTLLGNIGRGIIQNVRGVGNKRAPMKKSYFKGK
jgi:hypothetical protein